jgi:hypothetical protein
LAHPARGQRICCPIKCCLAFLKSTLALSKSEQYRKYIFLY